MLGLADVMQSTAWAAGVWGVDAFFVLSGFLLGVPFVEAILGMRAFPDLGLYARRRFLRIWPLYAASIAFALALVPWTPFAHTGVRDVVTHLALVHGFFPRYVWGANDGPLWTMSVDAQFYVLLPALAYVAYRALRRYDASFRARLLWVALATTVAGSLAYRYGVLRVLPAMRTYIGPDFSVWLRGIAGMSADFALGGALAVAKVRGVRVRRAVALAAIVAGIVLALGEFAFAMQPFDSAWRPALVDLVGGAGAAALLFGLTHYDGPRLRRVVESAPVAWRSKIAYAGYLFHMPILVVLASALGERVRPGSTAFFAIYAIAAIAIVIPFATLAHRYVETPFLRMKDRARESASFAAEPLVRIAEPIAPSKAGRQERARTATR